MVSFRDCYKLQPNYNPHSTYSVPSKQYKSIVVCVSCYKYDAKCTLSELWSFEFNLEVIAAIRNIGLTNSRAEKVEFGFIYKKGLSFWNTESLMLCLALSECLDLSCPQRPQSCELWPLNLVSSRFPNHDSWNWRAHGSPTAALWTNVLNSNLAGTQRCLSSLLHTSMISSCPIKTTTKCPPWSPCSFYFQLQLRTSDTQLPAYTYSN
jgi:hypothetical protein